MRLVARLCPDPPGELTALPQIHSWIKGGGIGKGKGRGGRGKGRRAGEDPQCLKCVDANDNSPPFWAASTAVSSRPNWRIRGPSWPDASAELKLCRACNMTVTVYHPSLISTPTIHNISKWEHFERHNVMASHNEPTLSKNLILLLLLLVTIYY